MVLYNRRSKILLLGTDPNIYGNLVYIKVAS